MATLEEIRQELIRRGAIEPTPIGTAALRSAGDVLTLGFGDELRGGLEYISAVNRGASGEEATQLRDRATGASRRRLEEARTDRPWTTGGVGVAASLIPYTGAARLARMGLGAGRLARTIQAAPVASRTRALSRLTARNQAAPPQALAAVGAQGEAVGHRLAARLAPRLHRANRQALYGSSAGVGALYGAGSGQTPEERLIGGGVGTLAGLGGAAAGEALGNVTAAVTRRGLDPQTRALRMIDRARREKQPTEQDLRRRLVRGGMSPSRAGSEARRMIQAGEGGEMSLADIRNRARAAHSRPTTPSMLQVLSDKRLARAIHSVGGRGAAILDQALDVQQGSLGRDVATQLERTFRPRGTRAPGAGGRGRSRGQGGGIDNQPPPTGLQELNERLTVAQRAQNREAYDIAYRATLTPEAQQAAARRMTGGTFKERARQSAVDRAEEDMARVADDLDNAQTTGASATEIQRLTNELADTVRARQALTSLGGDSPNPALLNTRAIDLYQRGLRHLADDAGGGATEGGRNIAAVRRTFMENLRSISPELHQAVGTARGFKALEEARDLGRSILRPGKQDEVDQLLRRRMTTDEQDAFLIGALDAIEAKLGANELSFVRQLQRNQNWRDLVMRSARSRSAGERLLQTIDDKVAERDLTSYIREGSQTTPRAQDVARYSDEGELISLQEALGSGDLKSSLLRVALEQANKIPVVGHRGVRDPAVGAELARILTQPGTRQNAALLAQRLRAAPKTSALTPEGQRTASGLGLGGAGLTTQGATRFPEEAAALTPVADIERAGDAFSGGRYAEGSKHAALAALGLVPLLRGPRLALGLTAGLGATAAGAGVAGAQDNRGRERDALRSEMASTQEAVRQIESEAAAVAHASGNRTREAVMEAQRVLQGRGLYDYEVDGNWGPVMRGAVAEFDRQNATRLEPLQERLAELRQQEAMQELSPSPAEEARREAMLGLGAAGGALLGKYGLPIPQRIPGIGRLSGALGRTGTARAVERRLADQTARADAMQFPTTPLTRRSAANDAQAAERAARLNEFWTLGGARQRVPFRIGTGQRPEIRPGAVEAPRLFHPPRFSGEDFGYMGLGVLDAGAAGAMLPGAQRELAEAQRAAQADPGDRTKIARVERARENVFRLEMMTRIGGGYVGGRVLGGYTHGYERLPRPSFSAAQAEQGRLARYLAPPRPRTPRK